MPAYFGQAYIYYVVQSIAGANVAQFYVPSTLVCTLLLGQLFPVKIHFRLLLSQQHTEMPQVHVYSSL